MTSEQVMLSDAPPRAPRAAPGRPTRCVGRLSCALVAALFAVGCESVQPLKSPYPTRRVWAVLPLLNESGSAYADSFRTADDLIRQLESVSNINVLPLNRTLAAMQALKLQRVSSAAEAQAVMDLLKVDGLIAGSITAYDPYDPPKLGLVIELHTSRHIEARDAFDIRGLSTAATDPEGHASGYPDMVQVKHPYGGQTRNGVGRTQPVTVVSAVLDATNPEVVRWMKRYAKSRAGSAEGEGAWHRYRISMDLYSDFASYLMTWRMLEAERRRLQRLAQTIRPQHGARNDATTAGDPPRLPHAAQPAP